jgi:mono/diheme cytochrome c family protein
MRHTGVTVDVSAWILSCAFALLGITLGVARSDGFVVSANAAEAADEQAGFRIAHDVCARCHQVDWQPAPRPAAAGEPPPFAWIAREHPNYLDGVLLRPPHAMWGVDISPAQAASLKAYFSALTKMPNGLAQ